MIEHFCEKSNDIVKFDDVNETDGITSLVCSKCGCMIILSIPESLIMN